MNPTPAAENLALAAMRDVVVFWNVGERSVADIIYAACDLLVAGIDGPALRELAAVPIDEIESEDSLRLEHLLEFGVPLSAALDELGLSFPPRYSDAAECEALSAMAARAVAGTITPAVLADWAHTTFSHDGAGGRLSFLHDDYTLLDYNGNTTEDVDAEVMAEARRIVAHNENTPGPTGPGVLRRSMNQWW
jgi:hypothetical protein